MKFTKQTGGGSYLKGSEVKDGARVAILTEALPQESVFEGKTRTQTVAQVKVEGIDGVKNANINKPSVNALIEAYGEDSNDWIKKPCTLQTERVLIAGKRVTAVYFIPEGFELAEDAGGYLVITKKGGGKEAEIPVIEDEESIDVKDIPF